MKKAIRRTALIFLFAATSTWSQSSDVWQALLRLINIGEVSRIQLAHDCEKNPQFAKLQQLQQLCAKRKLIPNEVIEAAALPYLKQHLTEHVAKEAIAALSSEPEVALSRKLLVEFSSGKLDQFKPEDFERLQRRNESEYGRALSAFATDQAQGVAVAKAMAAYQPQ